MYISMSPYDKKDKYRNEKWCGTTDHNFTSNIFNHITKESKMTEKLQFKRLKITESTIQID